MPQQETGALLPYPGADGHPHSSQADSRALVHDPMLVLADEPTGNLDEETGERVLKLLLDLTRKQNKTLIMATHSPEVVPFADRVFRVHDGQLLTTAEAQPTLQSVPTPFIVPN